MEQHNQTVLIFRYRTFLSYTLRIFWYFSIFYLIPYEYSGTFLSSFSYLTGIQVLLNCFLYNTLLILRYFLFFISYLNNIQVHFYLLSCIPCKYSGTFQSCVSISYLTLALDSWSVVTWLKSRIKCFTAHCRDRHEVINLQPPLD